MARKKRGAPLHAEDPFSDLFLESKRRFFQNDQALFEDLKREIEDEPAILTTGISRTGEVKHTWSKLPVALNLFSGFIEEGDSQEPNRDMCDGPQDVYFHCTQIETDTKNAGKVELQIDPEECRGLDERHALGGQKNQGEWESGFHTCGLISSIALNDTPYQEMNLDRRIIMELRNLGLYQETEPDSAWNEDAEMELEMCEDELQHQATQNKHHFDKVEKAVGKSQKVQDRECEINAMKTKEESASNRHIGGAGVKRVSSQKLAVWPMLPGPQIRPLGQPQEQLDGFHAGTSSITTTKFRSRTTRVRKRTVWGSAIGWSSRRAAGGY